MDKPLITVIIPCYNAELYLIQALDSICSQTYQNLEILTINDGSKDKTLELLNDYAAKDKRIIVVNNDSNIGLIKTLNKGIALATGLFIARMDADDTCSLDRISILYEYLIKHPDIDIVSSGNTLMDQQEQFLKKMVPKSLDNLALKFVSFFSTPIVHAGLLAKTQVFKENLYNENYIHSEDYELFSRMILKGVKFGNINLPLYHIRVNLESVSYKYESTQIQTTISISKNNLHSYFNNQYNSELHSILINRINVIPKIDSIKEAFREFQKLRSIFLKNEQCSVDEIRQIDYFILEQKIDILLQSLKLTEGLKKIPLVFFLFLNINLFFNRRGFEYLKSKVVYKIKSR